MKPAWIIGFSGHRNLSQPELVKQALHQALSSTKAKIEAAGGSLHLYVSAAYGSDLLSIEVADSLEIPVHLVLPKPVVCDERGEVSFVEGFASDFIDDHGQPMHDAWSQVLDYIQKAQRGDGGWTYRLVNGTQVEPECYYDAGIQIMETADVFLTVWDKLPARGLGGTAEMVEQAEKLRLPMQCIDPETGAIERYRFDRFAPQNDEGQLLMQSLALDSSLSSEQQFTALDVRANKHSQRFRNALVKCIWLHALATITAAVAVLLHGTSLAAAQLVAAMALFEWVLVVIAWVKMKSMSRGETHEQWVQARFGTELMRAMFASITLIDPLHPAIARHKKKWTRFAVSAGLQIAAEQKKCSTWKQERDAYVASRLDDPRTGQIPHFEKKQAAAAPVFARLQRVQKAATAFAVIFVFGAFLYKGSHAVHGTVTGADIPIPEGWVKYSVVFFFKFLPIALPLIAGVASALRSAKDCGRRTFRYLELAERLRSARTQLIDVKTESSCRRCVGLIEEVLLDELIEWHLSEKQNGSAKSPKPSTKLKK